MHRLALISTGSRYLGSHTSTCSNAGRCSVGSIWYSSDRGHLAQPSTVQGGVWLNDGSWTGMGIPVSSTMLVTWSVIGFCRRGRGISTAGIMDRDGKSGSLMGRWTLAGPGDSQVQFVDGVSLRRAGDGWSTALTSGSWRKPMRGAQ